MLQLIIGPLFSELFDYLSYQLVGMLWLSIVFFFSTSTVQFHIAHLFEMQSKFDLAKEAYQAIIGANGMPPHIQSVAWRQLGMFPNSFFIFERTLWSYFSFKCPVRYPC